MNKVDKQNMIKVLEDKFYMFSDKTNEMLQAGNHQEAFRYVDVMLHIFRTITKD